MPLLAKISLGWNLLTLTSTPAYCNAELFTKVECFIVKAIA
jgi:hypothetical protein